MRHVRKERGLRERENQPANRTRSEILSEMRGTSWDQPHVQLIHTAVRVNHKSDDAEQGQGLKAGHQARSHRTGPFPTARGRLKLISMRTDEVALREEDHFLETEDFWHTLHT